MPRPRRRSARATRSARRRPAHGSPVGPTPPSSPMARSPKVPKSRAATTSSRPTTSTRHSRWPARSPPPSTGRSRCGRSCSTYPPSKPVGNRWIALLLRAGGKRRGTRHAGMGRRHRAASGVRCGRRRPHQRRRAPSSAATATTVRVRDGEVLLTDGPYVEGAEVANGYYIIDAADRDEAIKFASMIPATTVEAPATHGHLGALITGE